MMYAAHAIAIAVFANFVDSRSLPMTSLRHGTNRRELVSQPLSCLEAVDLSFKTSVLKMNNLGGTGPGTGNQVIMYDDVGSYGGDSIDLVVSVKDGSNYITKNSNNNGLRCMNDATDEEYLCDLNENVNGYFGQINLDQGEKTTLLFRFYKGGSYPDDPEPFVLPAFKASIYDIDMGSNGVVENVVVKGWKTAMYDGETDEAGFSEDDSYCDSVSGEVNCLHAYSTQQGAKCGTWTIFLGNCYRCHLRAKGP